MLVSLELMRYSISMCTYQTYDRPNIESWVSTNNTTCHVTCATLTLIPNHTLHRLIQERCVDNCAFDVEQTPFPTRKPSLVCSFLNLTSSYLISTHLVSSLRRFRQLLPTLTRIVPLFPLTMFAKSFSISF